MDGKQAKVVISASDGRIEFEGSEAFVEKQLETFGDLIKEAIQRSAKQKHAPPDRSGEHRQPAGAALKDYENVFADAEGKIQILKDIPGASAAQKMVNVALLLTLGNTLASRATTTFQEIRDMCVSHGCLDSSNFASTLKEEKTSFIFGGGPRSGTVQLSKPGRSVAEKLASDLNK